MAAPAAALAVNQAVRSRTVRYLVAAIICAPAMFVVMLVMLLSGGAAADALTAPATPAALRPGLVPASYQALVQQAALTCPGITAPLLAAQLEAESGWNPNAVSPAGAQGLAQFIPDTWLGEGIDGDGDGVRDPFNPADAIASQASFMCKLLAAVTTDRRLAGDPIDLALAGYNAGLGAVQAYQGVPPYAETQAYITHIRAQMAHYSDPVASAPAGPAGDWVRPIQGAPITSEFGERGGRLHAGVDFGAPIGTPIVAASNGTALAAGPVAGFGQWVKLQHAGNVTTVYGHISRWTVTVGQAITAGQLIAYSGNEGHSTGPHLHFEVRFNDQPVDPVPFLSSRGVSLT